MQKSDFDPPSFHDPVFLQNGNLENLSNLGKKKYFQKKTVLHYLYTKGNLSNPEVCKLTNMSSPSIHKLLIELIDQGLVQEEGIGHSIGGRRPLIFGLNPDSRYIIGVNISINFSEVAIFSICNQLINKVHVFEKQLENTPDFVDSLYAFCLEVLDEHQIEIDKILGVGVGIPGLTDPSTGKSFSWLNYSELTVKEIFEEKFGKPVFVDNDARVMALGEYVFGSAKGKSNVLCLNIGAGIGMGMILNGMPYHGHSGFAGEFGHIKVEEDGDLCICGKRGCLETMASGDALVKRMKEEIELGKATKILALVNDDPSKITCTIIVEAARQGDQLSIDLLSAIGEYLGKGLATLIHLFNPEAIILGGKLAPAKQFIIDPIQQTLNKYTIYNIKKDTSIVTSQLQDNAAVMGAMALAMNNIFEDVRTNIAV